MDGPDRAEFEDCFDGFLVGKRYLNHDRDPPYAVQFTETLAAAGPIARPKQPYVDCYVLDANQAAVLIWTRKNSRGHGRLNTGPI